MDMKLSGFSNISSEQSEAVTKRLQRLTHTPRVLDEVLVNHKEIHKTEKNALHDIKINAFSGGQIYHAQSQDRNLLVALDKAVRTVESAIAHEH